MRRAGVGAPELLQEGDILQGANPEDAVVCLDWFAVHLHEDVKALCRSWGVKVIYLGGGITGDVQTLDTHKHWPMSNHYRIAEINDASRQLEIRPHRLPNSSRATVYRRAVDAWKSVGFPFPEKPWLDNGCLQDLSRDGDASVSTSLLPLWLEAGMPERRDQILAEVEARWNSGELECWDDFWRDDFLLPYDEHAPLQEGREDAQAEILEEDEDAPAGDGDQTDTEMGTIEVGPDKISDEFASLIAGEVESFEELPNVPKGAVATLAGADHMEEEAIVELEQSDGGTRLQYLLDLLQDVRGRQEEDLIKAVEKQSGNRFPR
jgi:hypothetical protein